MPIVNRGSLRLEGKMFKQGDEVPESLLKKLDEKRVNLFFDQGILQEKPKPKAEKKADEK